MRESTKILNESIDQLITEGLGSIQVVPAYGRDYKSKKAVEADWKAGKDFMIADMSSPHDGRYINLQDAKQAGIKQVKVRFKKLRSVTIIYVK